MAKSNSMDLRYRLPEELYKRFIGHFPTRGQHLDVLEELVEEVCNMMDERPTLAEDFRFYITNKINARI